MNWMRSAWTAGILALMMIAPTRAAHDQASLAEEIATANRAGSGTIPLSRDIVLSEPLPAIRSDISIEGNGHGISGDDKFRVFVVDGGSLTIKNATLSNGKAESGGAIHMSNGATLTLEGATLRGNIADKTGGAIYANGGMLRIRDSNFERNCAEIAQHKVEPGSASARQARSVDAYGCLQVTYIWPKPEDVVKLIDGTGGAIRLLNGAAATIEASNFSNNKATAGGALAMSHAQSQASIIGSGFTSNFALKQAGAVFVDGGEAVISRSAFQDNHSAWLGGAIVGKAGQIRIENSSFHNNRASSSGGVMTVAGADVTITHATMTNNAATHVNGDAIKKSAGSVKLRNSIVHNPGGGDDCAGGLDEMKGNLSADGTCSLLPAKELRLGALTGSPAYIPLLDYSPAVDAADPAYCLASDQMGTARPQGGGCDIGAIESTKALPAPIPIEPPPPCPLALKIIAANTDEPAGGCPAGNGHDIITFSEDIMLAEPLPHISSDITIEGNGFSISGANRFRIFSVDAGMLTINNLTLTGGSAMGQNQQGGAIRIFGRGQVVVNDSRFINNRASEGGAISAVLEPARLTVSKSRFQGNQASADGGAIEAGVRSKVTIANSSFLNNKAYTGGAISTHGGIVDVSNSAFTGNQAYEGGAIYARWAFVTLTHLSMWDNYGGWNAALWAKPDGIGWVKLRNSLILGRGSIPACYGRLAQNTGNFIADGSCSPKLSGDPLLGEATGLPLAIALQPASPAIDAADPAYCLASDQLGNPRPRFGLCDIGAIESVPVSRPIADCRLTTTHSLNFRDSPGGERFGSLPEGANVAAIARTPGWFQVAYRGASGWISADYVNTEGACE